MERPFEKNRTEQTFVLPPDHPGCTVGDFLRREAKLSRHQVSALKFREGGIRVNGEPARTSTLLYAGDVLCLRLKAETEAVLVPGDFDAPPDILFEDGAFLVVSKPAGQVCHPSPGHYADSLANQTARYAVLKGEAWGIRLAGRLDKDTSGCVVIAKSAEAAALLSRTGALEKTYYAVAEGRPEPPCGTIRLPIAPDPDRPGRMKTGPGGKSAGTVYETIFSSAGQSLLRLRLEHGRTHQIRVHLAAAGHPLAGDPLYGNGIPGKTRTLLHCESVRIRHPFTGRSVLVRAPFPPDWPVWALPPG